jgi:hypothetical protein
VEPIWASLLAKALEGKDVKELLSNVGSGGGAPAVGGGAAAAAGAPAEAAAEAKEEKKEEEKEESDDDMVRITFCFSFTSGRCLCTLRRHLRRRTFNPFFQLANRVFSLQGLRSVRLIYSLLSLGPVTTLWHIPCPLRISYIYSASPFGIPLYAHAHRKETKPKTPMSCRMPPHTSFLASWFPRVRVSNIALLIM